MTTEANPRVRGFGPSRAEVLEHLRGTGAAEPVAAIALAVGLHENTTRFHLDALIEAGMVHREAEGRQRPGRPRVLYRADPVPSQTHYQDLAAAMVRHFAGPMEDRGSRAEQAGVAWGSELLAELPAGQPGTMPRLVACLATMGYQPELVAGSPPVIELRPCPYAALADEDPVTVCRLHLGLIRGLIDDKDPWEVAALEPYATPELCIVRFTEKAS
ncbi:MAG TPA: helix-turn-helix domain-containing protein [Propionicimonas sp.]|nr:helix-turn-helix domain-containing protein [Propionicimonas sp.]